MKRITITSMLICITIALSGVSLKKHHLWETANDLRSRKIIDLTHTFNPDIPHWKGFPKEKTEEIYTYEKGGFLAYVYTHVGQWGTHCDAPSHFHRGKRTIDRIPPKEMILPLVVLDVHDKTYENSDYVISIKDIQDWERKFGKIPEGAFVAMRTDWSNKWPYQEKMENVDNKGIAHYPGWSLDVLKLLYEERKITASGHETTDTDPGLSTSKDNYECESYILSKDHYQIEMLTNLDKVPQAGAMIVVTFPKPENGSGFPARAFAVLP